MYQLRNLILLHGTENIIVALNLSLLFNHEIPKFSIPGLVQGLQDTIRDPGAF